MCCVVIIGMGMINVLGCDVCLIMEVMCEGCCGIGLLEFCDVDWLVVKIGGQVCDWDVEQYFNCQQIVFYDKFIQFILLLVCEVVEQLGLVFEGELGLCLGVVLGIVVGGMNIWDENYWMVYEEGKNCVYFFVVLKLMNNVVVLYLSFEYGLMGLSFIVVIVCVSFNYVMGMVFNMVWFGVVVVMLIGGFEVMLCFGGVKVWEGLCVMFKDGCWLFLVI